MTLFDTDTPRLFGLAPGVDYPRALLDGLHARLQHAPPEALAQVEIFVNTRRMERRLHAIYQDGPSRLLPRILLLTDLGQVAPEATPVLSPLRRRLELARLVSGLIAARPDLAPSTAAFDLADSLAALLDEMQGEGVQPADLAQLDVGAFSAHWARSLAFLGIVQDYLRESGTMARDTEARQRAAVLHRIAAWKKSPPLHPILIAGSTGSRGTTALLIDAVARLPQGAVILPGFDFDQPPEVWSSLDSALSAEDHPQYRFVPISARLGLDPASVTRWGDASPPDPARNRLVSLALRPAPVTDQWLRDAPALGPLDAATQGLTLIEAPSPRIEALAIALRLRAAVEAGQKAALISPDRGLTRQVTAALDRWRILPDDSAGMPLLLSPPGRLLHQVARLIGRDVTPEALIALLKHPLTHSVPGARGQHLLWSRDFEIFLRRQDVPMPMQTTLATWAANRPDAEAWAAWLVRICAFLGTAPAALGDHVARHLRVAEWLAAGPLVSGAGRLWDKAAGAAAQSAMADLTREAPFGGDMSSADYLALFVAHLGTKEVREPVQAHPDVMIWGTLEARVQGADLVILGGLNEGTWPQQHSPDPWLNRQMRHAAGLLLPDRRTGLAAHDFQQAIGASQVVLSRATRDADAETVASRWLNRLTNLIAGCPEQNGEVALTAMRARGRTWVDRARDLSISGPVSPQKRPSPRPPVGARPRELSVTRIETLVRDPYAIYAARILGLGVLPPLRRIADPRLRGTLIHRILKQFTAQVQADAPDAPFQLLEIAEQQMSATVPWPAARLTWLVQLRQIADWLVATERTLRDQGSQIAAEHAGRLHLPAIDFTLIARADRIDRLSCGALRILDYKTGAAPSADKIRHFDKQLLLEALIAEAGGFDVLSGRQNVGDVAHVSLKDPPKLALHPLGPADETFDLGHVRAQLIDLIAHYDQRAAGYSARQANDPDQFAGDYDQLARYGEWDETNLPQGEDVG